MSGHISYPRTAGLLTAQEDFRNGLMLATSGSVEAAIKCFRAVIASPSASKQLKEIARRKLNELLSDESDADDTAKGRSQDELVREGGTRPIARTRKLGFDVAFNADPDPAYISRDAESQLYVRDILDRPVGFQGRLKWDPNNARSKRSQASVSGSYRQLKVNVDASHLVARSLGGTEGDSNLVPLPEGVNRKDIGAFEKSVRTRLEQGEVLFWTVEVVYAGSTRIPQRIMYSTYRLAEDGTPELAEVTTFVGSN